MDRNHARALQGKRLTRTVLLGFVALVLGVYWIGNEYGVDREVMLEYLVTTLMFVGALIGAGLFGALCLYGLKRLFQSKS